MNNIAKIYMSSALAPTVGDSFRQLSIKGMVEEAEHLLMERRAVDIREPVNALVEIAEDRNAGTSLRVSALNAVNIMMLSLQAAVQHNSVDAKATALGEVFTARAKSVGSALIKNAPEADALLGRLLNIAGPKDETTGAIVCDDNITVREAAARSYQVVLTSFGKMYEHRESEEHAEWKADIRRAIPNALWDAPVRTDRPGHRIYL